MLYYGRTEGFSTSVKSELKYVILFFLAHSLSPFLPLSLFLTSHVFTKQVKRFAISGENIEEDIWMFSNGAERGIDSSMCVAGGMGRGAVDTSSTSDASPAPA